MTLQKAIEARHSVRAYKNEPLADDVVKALEEQITCYIAIGYGETQGVSHKSRPSSKSPNSQSLFGRST